MGGRTDTAALKRALRKGRERGCSIYISAEQLEAAGIDPHGPSPLYRIWEAPGRPRFVVNLYPAAAGAAQPALVTPDE